MKIKIFPQKIFLYALLFCGFLLGCSTASKMLGPRHDEVLIFNLPYDLTFLRTLEALQKNSDWDLELTEKEKGLISVYNHAYTQLGDADQRTVHFVLKRISRDQTSVQIDSQDQRVPGAGTLMEQIASTLEHQY